MQFRLVAQAGLVTQKLTPLPDTAMNLALPSPPPTTACPLPAPIEPQSNLNRTIKRWVRLMISRQEDFCGYASQQCAESDRERHAMIDLVADRVWLAAGYTDTASGLGGTFGHMVDGEIVEFFVKPEPVAAAVCSTRGVRPGSCLWSAKSTRKAAFRPIQTTRLAVPYRQSRARLIQSAMCS